jgi:surface carbohydrate biosynthesis protein (TIGR04326 family)
LASNKQLFKLTSLKIRIDFLQMPEKKEAILLVLDSNEKFSQQNDIVYWNNNQSSNSKKIFSIPKLVEKNADLLRSKYLLLIYDLGQSKSKNKRILDVLEIRPGLSYWWMTLLNEKSNLAKSPQIDNIIKLMAFKDFLVENKYKHFVLSSSDKQLARSMLIMSDQLKIKFVWKQIKQKKSKNNLLYRIYKFLPYVIQGLIWLLRYLVSYWRFRGLGVNEWKNSQAKLTFVSYLFNLDKDSMDKHSFNSNYWTVLPKVMKKKQIETNWLHIYDRSSLLPDVRSAVAVIKGFNKSKKGHQVHTTIHSFISIQIVVSVIKDWFKLIKLEKLIAEPLKSESSIYWPLMERDLSNSLLGPIAVSNLLNLHLFEKAIFDLPKQEKGAYLQENHAWEFAFIYFWRAAGHKPNLFGIPHTVIRFWDLRYYFASKHYDINNRDFMALPLPDLVCVNGQMAKEMYLKSGYPQNQLVEVEALRYLHLIDAVEHKKINHNKLINNKILVLGDYVKENTDQQMQLLNEAVKNNSTKNNLYIVKPHPACPIVKKDYSEINMNITNDPISTIIKDCSLVYVSSMTSASVDAFCLGKPIVSVFDPKSLNLSPLKGIDGVTFISTSQELEKVLGEIDQIKITNNKERQFFYLDYKIPRWRELLDI